MSKTSNPQVIIITGSSSGFGLLTAAHLAACGHIVYATMRNLDKQAAVINEAKKRDSELTVLPLDVTDVDSIKKAIATIASKHGFIDVLVNNAGYGIGGFFEDLSQEEIRAQFETNFFGVQNVTREVIPLMRQRKKGKIINISSVSGFHSSPAFGAYSSSKWALEAFSESLRYELQAFGIKVFSVRPGTYKTDIFFENARYAQNFDNKQSPYFEMSQHLRREVIDYVDHLKKDPEDIAKLVAKLIESKTNKFRHIPDVEGKSLYFFRRVLPFSLFSRMINSALFHNKKEVKLK